MLHYLNGKSAVETSQSVHRGLINREVKSAEKSYSVRSIHTHLLPESVFRSSISQITDRFFKRKQRKSVSEITVGKS